MPVYEFESPEGKVISVLVRLDEPDHLRQVQVENGVTYKRVYAAPRAAHDTKGGALTKEDFGRMMEGKNLTVQEARELSEELSRQRAAERGGVDPVKERFYADYERQMGQPHIDIKKRRAREAAAKSGIRIRG